MALKMAKYLHITTITGEDKTELVTDETVEGLNQLLVDVGYPNITGDDPSYKNSFARKMMKEYPTIVDLTFPDLIVDDETHDKYIPIKVKDIKSRKFSLTLRRLEMLSEKRTRN